MTTSGRKKNMTEAALVANRENGKLNPGPGVEAQERTKFNAWGNGLTGVHVLHPSEDRELFRGHINQYLASFLPQNYFQCRLIIRMAQNDWRLQRSVNNDPLLAKQAHNRSDAWREKLNQTMHEQRLENNNMRCLQAFLGSIKLEQLQELRAYTVGEALPVMQVDLKAKDFLPPEDWLLLPYDVVAGEAEQAHLREIELSLMNSADKQEAVAAYQARQEKVAHEAMDRIEAVLQTLDSRIEALVTSEVTEDQFLEEAHQQHRAVEADILGRSLTTQEAIMANANFRARWEEYKRELCRAHGVKTWTDVLAYYQVPPEQSSEGPLQDSA